MSEITCVCVTTATPAMISVLYGTCFLFPFEANLWLSEWTASEDLGTWERQYRLEKENEWGCFQEWTKSGQQQKNENAKQCNKNMEGKKKTWMEHRRINHQLWDSQDNSTTAYCVALQSISPRSKSVWPTVRAFPAIACGNVIYKWYRESEKEKRRKTETL